MHKNVEVCQIELDASGKVNDVTVFENAEKHMPIGSSRDKHSFNMWWSNRAIPKTRNNVKTALEKLGYENTTIMLINNLALSLTDCYWIKPIKEKIKWEDINLYTNEFEDLFGEITIDNGTDIDLKNKTRFISAASPGELQKKWCIDKNKKRFLVKGNHGISYQQSLNEIFASQLHKTQSFDNYVEYHLSELTLKNGVNAIGCSSFCFCNESTESVSLDSIYYLDPKPNNISKFQHLRNQCIKFGIKPKEFDDFFDYLILTDFLITNTDRHLNNISILRDPDTLKIKGFAPIYDSGSSMFHTISTDDMEKYDIKRIKINSILEEKEIRMLKHVINRKAVDLSKLSLDFSIYDKDTKEYRSRKEMYKKMFQKKVDLLKKFQDGNDVWKYL